MMGSFQLKILHIEFIGERFEMWNLSGMIEMTVFQMCKSTEGRLPE